MLGSSLVFIMVLRNILFVYILSLFHIKNTVADFCYPNNACSDYVSYYILEISPKCFCVPDVGKDVNIITNNLIGSSEFHEITTEDGYILGVFRLAQTNPKGVVILQHPVNVCSRIWLIYGKESTAYWFWEQGYDVWLPNNRGALYSKKHIGNLTHYDKEYWNFSFHEMGIYDHKAVIDYIYNKTGKKIFFVGHSMSTTTSFIYSSYYPEEALEKLEVIISMGPISYLKNIRSPVIILGKIVPLLEIFNHFVGWHSLLALHSWYVRLAQTIVVLLPFKHIFVVVLNIFCGWTPKGFDPATVNLLVLSGVSEISWKTFYHYSQILNAKDGRFQMYDYGKEKNLQLYGEEKPLIYPLNKIRVPVYLMCSTDDSISTVKDLEMLNSRLSNETKMYGKHIFSGLNHADYHFSKYRRPVVYDNILELLSFINSKTLRV